MAEKTETSEHSTGHATAASKGSASRRDSHGRAAAARSAGLVERAMMVQLGAGLVVRDDIVSSLRKVSRKYGTSTGLEKQLTRFEKRGVRTRNRIERQIKRQRNQIERDVRARRKRLEDHATSFSKRLEGPAEAVGKRLEGPAHTVNAKVDGVTTKIEELISSAHGLIG